MITYNKDHENLTNAEIEWRDEIKKRELVAIKTSLGNVLYKQTHLKYMKARIGGKVSINNAFAV